MLAAVTIMGSGRLGPTVTALLGLTATVLAARALLQARRLGDRPSTDGRVYRRTILGLGASAVVLGAIFLAAADGGPGTGNGVVGSAAAVVFGLVAVGLDRVAIARRNDGIGSSAST